MEVGASMNQGTVVKERQVKIDDPVEGVKILALELLLTFLPAF